MATEDRLRFFGHILRRPADRLVQRALGSLSDSSCKRPPGRKRNFWTEMGKENLWTLGVDSQLRQGVEFHRIWNSDEWIDSVQALVEDPKVCAKQHVRGRHTSAKMRVIASGDGINPPINSVTPLDCIKELNVGQSYRPQNVKNGVNPLVFDKHSFLLFMDGFVEEIQTNALMADISFSLANIVHFISNSLPSSISFLWSPNGVTVCSRLLPVVQSPVIPERQTTEITGSANLKLGWEDFLNQLAACSEVTTTIKY